MDAVMKPNQLVFVWDGVVRLFHWATVLLCMLNFFVVKEGGRYHRYIGYTLAGLLLIRIIWGASILSGS
jgi:cytochrome b